MRPFSSFLPKWLVCGSLQECRQAQSCGVFVVSSGWKNEQEFFLVHGCLLFSRWIRKKQGCFSGSFSLNMLRNLVEMILAPHPGIAPNNDLSQEYRDHIKKFCPILVSYNLREAADHLQKWVDGELQLAPLLDTSAYLATVVLLLWKTCFDD